MTPDLILIAGLLGYCTLVLAVALDCLQSRRMLRTAKTHRPGWR